MLVKKNSITNNEMVKQSAELTFVSIWLLGCCAACLIMKDSLISLPNDISNLGQNDIISEDGVLPYHIRRGIAQKIYVTEEACITGRDSTLISA